MSLAMTSPMLNSDEVDFSSNAHSPHLDSDSGANRPTAFEVPSRHPDFCFDDGSVAILCGHQYFLVHQSILALHSSVFKKMVDASVADGTCHLIEGRLALQLPHMPNEMLLFLKAIYGYGYFSTFTKQLAHLR